MKKSILFFVAAFTFVALFSQSMTTSYVNGYKIMKGERPEINIRNVPVDAYHQGKIKIKIDRSYEKLLPDVKYHAGSKAFVETGIPELDALNAQFQAQSYTPLFGMLYETNSKSSDFRERHKAWGFHLWFTIELNENVSIADAVETYQALPFVEVAEPFYHATTHGIDKGRWTPNDPRLGEQWHYKNTGQVGGTPGCDVSLFDAWEIEKGNSQVIVAVMDCGIQATHPDLQANMWSGIGYNFFQNTATINPGDHGCHTGGTIAAVSNNAVGVAGVAGGTGIGDGVRLMTCQIFNPAGNSGGGFQASYVYAADNGACISQNSWGWNGTNVYEQATLDGIDYFIANGGGDVMSDGIVIFSAGNSYSDGNYYYGCYPPVLSVAGTTNTDTKAWYSNFSAWVDISAPGGETNSVNARGVLSCYVGGYGFMQGTSMACPHVSGAAALLVSYAIRNNFILSSQMIKDLLKDNVDNHYAVNPSYIGRLGTGRLNIYKAMIALVEIVPTVAEPIDLTATSTSDSEINLNWLKNEDDHHVILLTNSVNEFGVLQKGHIYEIGDLLPDGEEVLFFGDAESFNHIGLDQITTYYYKLFSYNEDYYYSKGVECEATTWCSKVEIPLFEGFEDGIPDCWEQENMSGESLWIVGKGNGGGFPNNSYEGENNIYFKMNGETTEGDITRLILPTIKMNGLNSVKLSFALYNQGRNELVDELSVYYKTSFFSDWILCKTYSENQNKWLLDSLILPVVETMEEIYICFQAKINGGRGICLDNILVEQHNDVGVIENELSNKVNIYPNPTTGELKITTSDIRNPISDITIFDVSGRIQKAENRISNIEVILDISHLNSGLYFIKVKTDAGEIIKKVVKN
jgi:subtilisin family serine protease